MDKKILFLVLLCTLVLPSIALAQLHYYSSGISIKSMVHDIEMAAGLIFGAVAVISFVVAGVLFLTASGAPEKIQQARSAFLWGVAGVIVGIVAFSIIAIVSRIIS